MNRTLFLVENGEVSEITNNEPSVIAEISQNVDWETSCLVVGGPNSTAAQALETALQYDLGKIGYDNQAWYDLTIVAVAIA